MRHTNEEMSAVNATLVVNGLGWLGCREERRLTSESSLLTSVSSVNLGMSKKLAGRPLQRGGARVIKDRHNRVTLSEVIVDFGGSF